MIQRETSSSARQRKFYGVLRRPSEPGYWVADVWIDMSSTTCQNFCPFHWSLATSLHSQFLITIKQHILQSHTLAVYDVSSCRCVTFLFRDRDGHVDNPHPLQSLRCGIIPLDSNWAIGVADECRSKWCRKWLDPLVALVSAELAAAGG